MGIQSKKEKDDGNNKKEQNRLQTAISPSIAGSIFVGGAVSNIGEMFGLFMNNEKQGLFTAKRQVGIILNNFSYLQTKEKRRDEKRDETKKAKKIPFKNNFLEQKKKSFNLILFSNIF